jgi:O-succinylbenzoic acid--CoA ligase
MYHMGGLAPTFRCALYGTTLVLQREFDATATAEVLEREDITGVSLVPTQLSRLIDAELSAPALRTILLGGAPASNALLDRADEAGLPVYPTYGLTETASQVATASPAERRTYPGTVGQPLFGTTVHLIDDGQPVKTGEQGEIVVDGPTVTPGYLDESQTRQAFSEFGLQTGDVGYRDEDGRLWVLGRLDDMIITGGELVAPAEVVEQVQAVPGVDDATVVGLDHDEWGEQVVTLVVPDSNSSGPSPLRERILNHCRDYLADYKQPKRIRFVETVPRTHSGTVDRVRARELARNDSDSL